MPGVVDDPNFFKNLPQKPGVYSMLDEAGRILYVGKASNLKNRISSYFQRQWDSKTLHLVQQIHDIQVTVTASEREALFLESNLIKTHQPKYNVLLKDDKSYPFLLLSPDAFPRLSFYRRHGNQKPVGKLYGPYTSAGAVREALNKLQSIFQLRQCDNVFFNNRSRPCLQYQIKRCSAPCVGYIDEASYRQSVWRTEQFLAGKDQELIKLLAEEMTQASEALDYEKAARLRDQLIQLQQLQASQMVVKGFGNIDVIGKAMQQGHVCLYVLSIREGKMVQSKPYCWTLSVPLSEEELFEAFLLRYYGEAAETDNTENNTNTVGYEITPPDTIIIDSTPQHAEALTQILQSNLVKSDNSSNPITPKARGITVTPGSRGDKGRWLVMATENAEQALLQRTHDHKHVFERFEALQEALQLPEVPERIECFDVSHTFGEATIASCVVFNRLGADKKAYRYYALTGLIPGDDYGAMREALARHYTKVRAESGALPDVLLIDGGRGQLKCAEQVLGELQITDITLVGVAKGAARKAGEETLYLSSKGAPWEVPAHSPAFHLIQQIRDEAHRFAITQHRRKRAKRRLVSQLDEIPSVGPKRRQQLLAHFGSLTGIKKASVMDLSRVVGIGEALAAIIYAALHTRSE